MHHRRIRRIALYPLVTLLLALPVALQPQFVAIAQETDGDIGTPIIDSESSDGDGITDVELPAPTEDTDDDGVDNQTDNCPDTANPDQSDTDADGIGDACDATPNDVPDPATDDTPDSEDAIPNGGMDGDGFDNPADICVDFDTDADGIGDACDPAPNGDTDGDGVDNLFDTCLGIASPDQLETDGTGDGCDETPAPVVPFDPVLDCQPAEGHQDPTAGAATWSLLDCLLTWETGDVGAVEAQIETGTPGWEVAIAATGSLIPQGDRQIDLANADPESDAFLQSQFVLGTRLSCDAPVSAALTLTFTAAVGENTIAEVVTRSVDIAGRAATAPNVQFQSAVFTAVDPAQGDRISSGLIVLTYSGAPNGCGWQLTITVNDFTSPEGIIPASNLTITELTGLPGAIFSHTGGTISILVPPDQSSSASGTLGLTVEIAMPEPIPEGDYTTTIAATATIP